MIALWFLSTQGVFGAQPEHQPFDSVLPATRPGEHLPRIRPP